MEVGDVTGEARGWCSVRKGSQAKEYRYLLEAGKGQGTNSPPEPQKDPHPPIPWLQPSETYSGFWPPER